MSEPKEPDLTGLRVGDFHVRVVPVAGTSDALDTEANRERARRVEEDRRAAGFGATGEGAGEAAQEAAEAAVDEAIEEARARLKGAGDEVPILLRDPVTGATFRLE
ncbi:hypothetical protein [Sorangium sp. So ce1000]|jgi:hypothetical protein|uniref:hypothetical protein n=1 Tax=Sorangium sp. So ce1000 TaxID=3133325 RepID=UPI003F5F9CDB